MKRTVRQWEAIQDTIEEIGDGASADEDQQYYDLSARIREYTDDALLTQDEDLDIPTNWNEDRIIRQAERMAGG